ncbi:MAG: hypothetical protein ACYC6V_10140 [Bacillota bacterium]
MRPRRVIRIAPALAVVAWLALHAASQPATAAGTSALHLDYDHLVLSQSGDRVTVKEAIGMANNGSAPLDRIVLPLPSGYADLKFETGFTEGKVAAQADGLVDTGGLGIGLLREVVFSYALPVNAGGTVTFTKRVDYGTAALSLTAEARSIRLAGSRGLAALTSDLNGVTYDSLKADDVAAGTSYDIQVTVGSFSTASAPPPGADTATGGNAGKLLNRSIHGGPDNVMLWQRFTGRPGHWGVPGIAIILGILVFGTGAITKATATRRAGVAKSAKSATAPTSTPERTALVRAIAELDRQFKLGRVTEADHRLRRTDLKRQLMDIVTKTEG